MILKQGEKVHIIHRRQYEKDHHRHFVGVVDSYEGGVARVTGNVYTVDPVKFTFMRRAETRTRLVAIVSADVLVNVLPQSINLEKFFYKSETNADSLTD